MARATLATAAPFQPNTILHLTPISGTFFYSFRGLLFYSVYTLALVLQLLHELNAQRFHVCAYTFAAKYHQNVEGQGEVLPISRAIYVGGL